MQTALMSRTESALVLPTGCERMKTQQAGLAVSLEGEAEVGLLNDMRVDLHRHVGSL
jgi:hypothetical protein